MQKSLTFTIAICSLNGEKRLPATLKNLFNRIPSGIKVIVVDDGSTDKSSDVARQHGAIVIRHEKNMGYGQARQSAVSACQTDILAFIDDECLVNPRWFSTLQKDWQLMYSNIAALAGPMIPTGKGFTWGYLIRNNPFAPIRLLPGRQSNFLQRLFRYLYPNYSLHSGFIKSAANGNLSLRISALSQISGYNTSLALGGEDEDLCARFQKEFGSESIFFDQKLWVSHDMKDSIPSSMNRSYRYGRASASAWMRSGGVPTFLPLPIVFFSVLIYFIIMAPWEVTLAFLIIYPSVVSLNKSTWKNHFFLKNLTYPYIRLILEIAHNYGFLLAFVYRKSLYIKAGNEND